MTKTMLKLKKEAAEDCKFQGHKMTRFKTIHTDTNRIICESACSICGKWAQCDTRPPANGIDIGGDAVALSCND